MLAKASVPAERRETHTPLFCLAGRLALASTLISYSTGNLYTLT